MTLAVVTGYFLPIQLILAVCFDLLHLFIGPLVRTGKFENEEKK